MLSKELGFVTSWKMLTRDKGWIKPVLVLTLIGWVPILGQIAVLGYGLEWARLTAWGIDAAPKQRGVDYGKVLTTGGIAFLVNMSMSIVVAILSSMIFGTTVGIGSVFGPIGSLFTDVISFAAATSGAAFGLIAAVVNIFMSTFVLAACMRSTVYDSFSAGWRVDRLFQMIMKDPGGFFHAYAVKLIGDIVVGAYSAVVAMLGAVFTLGGMAGIMAYGYGIDHFRYNLGQHLIDSLITMGPGLVMVIVLLVIAALFFGGVLSVAMQLVSINAMGQWFCRFDVNRWGTSSAPLPDGVPARAQAAAYGDDSIPRQPQQPQADSVAAQQPASAPSTAADPVSPVQPAPVPSFMEQPPVPAASAVPPAQEESPAADEEPPAAASLPAESDPASHPPIPLPPVSEPPLEHTSAGGEKSDAEEDDGESNESPIIEG